ncbi:hypothetical protein [Glycomyces sp. NPDC048151]|uniref:hypothetical protein n=1 Tax=Glycomyces sp. NPDC048151 TaxID=3364002 RepID=UPI00371AA1E9
MSQTPSQGGPPEGGDPRESPQGGWRPPAESGPQQSGPDPQSPAPGAQQPGWQQPPGGPGPAYGGSWQPPQGSQQYSGGQPPPPPPGGYGQQYQYGQPPPQGGKRTGLIIGVVVAVGVLLAGVLGVIGVNMMRGGNDEAATDSGTSEQAPSEEDQAEEEQPGQPDVPATSCLPYEPQLAAFGFDLSTGCDSPDAFWRITDSSDTTAATVTPDGSLADIQVAVDLCGADYARLQLGELWKDWYFTYDSASLVVEQLVCVEALGTPDAVGRVPIMPDTGSCFDDSDRWWTVPCELPEALYVVVDTVAVEPPRAMTLEEADAASAPCSGGALFWQVADADGRTTNILCGDPLLLA